MLQIFRSLSYLLLVRLQLLPLQQTHVPIARALFPLQQAKQYSKSTQLVTSYNWRVIKLPSAEDTIQERVISAVHKHLCTAIWRIIKEIIFRLFLRQHLAWDVTQPNANIYTLQSSTVSHRDRTSSTRSLTQTTGNVFCSFEGKRSQTINTSDHRPMPDRESK